LCQAIGQKPGEAAGTGRGCAHLLLHMQAASLTVRGVVEADFARDAAYHPTSFCVFCAASCRRAVGLYTHLCRLSHKLLR
jgi:hypothetical protein